eukprot:scaffold151681_cov47-Prasinocladus_malaysianus.AAC.2
MADGRSAIHVAAAYGHAQILSKLLTGQEVDAEKLAYKDWNFKMNPLHFALIYGQVDATKLLLEAGSDPNGAWTIEQENPYGASEKTPVSPLLVAGSVFKWDDVAGRELVRLLLQAGASPTRLDLNLNSLLHLGILDNNSLFIRALLELAPEVSYAYLLVLTN